MTKEELKTETLSQIVKTIIGVGELYEGKVHLTHKQVNDVAENILDLFTKHSRESFIDGFKKGQVKGILDCTYGQKAVEEALKDFVEQLKVALKETEIKGKDATEDFAMDMVLTQMMPDMLDAWLGYYLQTLKDKDDR